jgi:hypothetical protein
MKLTNCFEVAVASYPLAFVVMCIVYACNARTKYYREYRNEHVFDIFHSFHYSPFLQIFLRTDKLIKFKLHYNRQNDIHFTLVN